MSRARNFLSKCALLPGQYVSLLGFSISVVLMPLILYRAGVDWSNITEVGFVAALLLSIVGPHYVSFYLQKEKQVSSTIVTIFTCASLFFLIYGFYYGGHTIIAFLFFTVVVHAAMVFYLAMCKSIH